MKNLINDKTNKGQKIFALALLGGAIFGAMKLFNAYLAPVMIGFFENVWKMIFIGLPLVMIGAYIIFNPMMVWGFFKTLSWKFTSWLIKMDPLSVMDRYADWLTNKLRNLNQATITLGGQKITLEREIERQKQLMETNLKRGAAARETGNMSQASLAGVRAKAASDSIKLYTPNYQRMDRSLRFMKTLAENWDVSITTMKETIENKRTEWKMLKNNAKALNQAEEFIKGDTEEGKIYKESIKALEEMVSQKIAYIEDFEEKAKPVMEGAKIDKQMAQNEGLDMLERYMNDGKLLMPDFSKMDAVDIQYEMVPTGASKFNLLQK